MLKGVHHWIVEIRQTEDPFFERALLFIRADCAEDEQRDWQEKGRAFLKQATPYAGLRRARLYTRLRAALYMVVGGVCGVLIGAMIANIP